MALDVSALLQIRLYGGAKTPAKFAKMLNQHVDGVLYGQYVFNGAGQTGRASSRGVQVHNLARDPSANEPELIDALLNRCDYATLAGNWRRGGRAQTVAADPPDVRTARRIACSSGRTGRRSRRRVLPWLCDHLDGARQRLEIFRASMPTPRSRICTPAPRRRCLTSPIEQVTKAIRQRGKVAELALGFCGGVGALQAMAAGYGLHLSAGEAIDDRGALARRQPVGAALFARAVGRHAAGARHAGP